MAKKYLPKPQINVDKELPSDFVNTFRHAIWPFLAIAQFVGVLPVSGIREKDVTRVHFKWFYVGVPVSMILIGFGTIDLILSLKVILEKGVKMYSVGPAAFSFTSLMGLVAFFHLARCWPDLMAQYTGTEKLFLEKSYETKDPKGFCGRLRLYGGLLLFGAVVEHGMSLSNAIYNNYLQINNCNLTVNFWDNFFIRERKLFTFINFHVWMIPLSEWLTIGMTFTWNFIDIFQVLMTNSLAIRFDQVNKRIRRFTSFPMTDEFWLRARMDFMSLLDLLQAVDDHLSALVLLSYANNLYFICFQVFLSFQIFKLVNWFFSMVPCRQRGNIVNTIYFWYSLCYVLTRILTMMLSAASINDKGNDILTAFYEIPMDLWGFELERFYEIVSSDSISASGKGFYFITRRMIFAMAGTVMTYELVLLDQVKDVVDRVDYCTSKKVA